MCEEQRFRSILAPFINGLLAEKRALGFDYHTEELILARFDRYCAEAGLDTLNITRGVLDKWCTQTDTEGLSYRRKRVSVVRQLMLYMATLGAAVCLPKNNGRRESVIPHIFTREEILALFHEIDRLLYCCGLRNSEGCGIAAEQVDLTNGILTILDSKGSKDRLVYMADDLSALCGEYYEYLCDELRHRPRWFFPGKDPDKPLKNTSVDRVFNRFWAATKFSSACNNKPTVHDLRFTFVTDRIDLWVMEGIDTDVMMPYLQKYLGHKNLQDSYYYYHNSRQLYESIRIMDKTIDQVIPEVPGHE